MIPIIFIHYGNNSYLEYTFRMAVKFNPRTDIYLLGDEVNIKYSRFGIKHLLYKKYLYGNLLEIFNKNYQHISNISNNFKLLFNFQRWFILYNFMVENNINRCWHFDTDTLICSDLSVRADRFSEFSLAVANHISGCICLVNSREALVAYLEKAAALFSDHKFVQKQKAFFEDCQGKKELYSFCDMTVFRELQKDSGPLGETSDIIDAESFDPNINLDRADQIETEPVWEMDTSILGLSRPIKKLYFIKGLPHCYHLGRQRMIRLNTLNMSWIPAEYTKEVFERIMNYG